MATSPRRYRLRSPSNAELTDCVGSSAAYNAVFVTPVMLPTNYVVIDIDNGIAGYAETLDEYMAQKGYVFEDVDTVPPSLPGLAVSNDATTGIFYVSAGVIGVRSGGATVFQFNANGGVIPLGSAALPSLAPTGDPNTGIWSGGADRLSISSNGVESVRVWQAGGAAQVLFPDGAAAANPGISFLNDPDTGIGRSASNDMVFNAGATTYFRIVSSQLRIMLNGSAGSPFITWNSDVDTGIFRVGTNQLGLSAGGVERLRVDDSAVADEACLLISVAGAAVKRVSQAAADSGGVGFRMLVVPN